MVFYKYGNDDIANKKIEWELAAANKYILLSIIFPEQVMYLIRSVYTSRRTGVLSRIASALEKEVGVCRKIFKKELSEEWNISEPVLEMADKLYSTFDETVLSACLNDKIDLWKLAFYVSYNQSIVYSSLQISISPAKRKRIHLILSKDGKRCLGEFLNDYSEDFDAWLDHHIYNDCEYGGVGKIGVDEPWNADQRLRRLHWRLNVLISMLICEIPPINDDIGNIDDVDGADEE